MSRVLAAQVRGRLRQPRVQAVLVLAVIAIVAVLIVLRLPRRFEATGTLDECHFGSPVVVFDGGDPGGEWAVESWPGGLRYDGQAHVLLGANGEALFRRGDRVRVKGSIVEVHGDIAPCFQGVGVQVEAIAAP